MNNPITSWQRELAAAYDQLTPVQRLEFEAYAHMVIARAKWREIDWHRQEERREGRRAATSSPREHEGGRS